MGTRLVWRRVPQRTSWGERGSMRRVVWQVAMAAVLAAGFGSLPLGAQGAGTLHPLDPALLDLARLEAAGLVPRNWVAQRPYSIRRVTQMVADAQAWLVQDDAHLAGRPDLEAIVLRLRGRFAPEGSRRISAFLDAEVGGGDSPGRGYADNGIGELDAVANPLWAYRAGRAYGDRFTAAGSARLTVPLGERVAIGVAGRSSGVSHGGILAGDDGVAVEAAYLRAVVGRMALQVGRDSWSWGLGGPSSILMSDNGPPLDLIRLSTERPWRLAILGETELTVTVADLGPSQNFPGANLFGAKLSIRPTTSLRVGMSVLNKQMGGGAPDASTSERIKDLSFVWDLFRPGRDYVFSEKLISLDARAVFPERHGLEVMGEITLTDLGPDRIRDILQADGAYRLSAGFARLGKTGRHSVHLAGARVGPRVYRHHQFSTGLAVQGQLQGLELGPDGRSIALKYGYHPAARGWDGGLTLGFQDRSVDGFLDVYDPVLDFVHDPATDRPNGRRGRLEGRLARVASNGARGIELSGGLERVHDFANTLGVRRTNVAVLVRGWISF